MTVRILTGDCRDMLRTLPDESVHCVVTSPPYWGLRDYGTARWQGGDPACPHEPDQAWIDHNFNAKSAFGNGASTQSAAAKSRWYRPDGSCRCGAARVDQQLGLERSLGEHVAVMVEVFREVRRVLRKDGTLWLNYGDSYATSVNGRSAADTKAAAKDDQTFRDKPFSTVGPVFRPGSGPGEGGIPGGRNRNGVTVDAASMLKPKDLCGIPWRVAFALQEDGWYLRQDIIWAKPNPMPESIRDRCTKSHEYLFLLAKSPRYYFDQEAIRTPFSGETKAQSFDTMDYKARDRYKKPDGWDTGKGGHGSVHRNGREKGELVPADYVPPSGANKRSVWTVPTEAYRDAHFATFPPALIEPCIKAGCPAGGTVLDPFGGAGTTGLVADRLQRSAILIELNPEYAAMARKRIEGDAPLFAAVDDYDSDDDVTKSFNEAYRAIRERVAAGGRPWKPKVNQKDQGNVDQNYNSGYEDVRPARDQGARGRTGGGWEDFPPADTDAGLDTVRRSRSR